MNWLFLAIAIVSEVIATSALKSSSGFTRIGPSILVVIGYAAAFYFLSLTMRSMPMGLIYAIWSGVGIVLIALVGLIMYKQTIDIPAVIGISLITLGVLVINLFSKSGGHA